MHTAGEVSGLPAKRWPRPQYGHALFDSRHGGGQTTASSGVAVARASFSLWNPAEMTS
jgi:hypothetical protein